MAKIESYINKDGIKLWKIVGLYLGVDDLTGKPKRTNRQGFKTRREAQLMEAKLLSNVEEIKKQSPKFSVVYEEWLGEYENTVEGSTFITTKAIFENHILPFFGEAFIDNIKHKHIKEFVDEKIKYYVKTYEFIGYIRRVCNFGIPRGYLTSDPTKNITFPTNLVKKTEEKNTYWSLKQVNSFLNFINKNKKSIMSEMYFVALWLVSHTGIRRGELAALNWENIDFKTQLLEIKYSMKNTQNGMKRGSTKTDNIRKIYLDIQTINYLKEWRIIQIKHFGMVKYIFNNTTGERVALNMPNNKLQEYLNKYNAKNEEKLPSLTIHGFRHSHTTHLVLAGVPIHEVMARLGHSDYNTTMKIYNEIQEEQLINTNQLYQRYLDTNG